ncbi:MAG: diguanylate cyclase, partial [Deltaproteobacteria bacterium]|nr:diguanylate cyclase [Deltaproteobacteria bacterium]
MNRKMTCEAPSTISYQYDIFSTVGRILTSSLDPQEVFQRVMTVIGEFFAPRHWSLLLQDEVTGQLRFEIVMGLDPEKMSNVVLMPGEG